MNPQQPTEQTPAPQVQPPVAPSTAAQPPGSSPKKRRGLLLIIIGAALLIIIGGALLALKQKDAPTTQSEPELKTAQISITKDGMIPATLQISANTQVTWTNNDDLDLGHQLQMSLGNKNKLPEFNENLALGKGETYSFSFTKPGTYNFGDKKNPVKFQGVIIVQ